MDQQLKQHLMAQGRVIAGLKAQVDSLQARLDSGPPDPRAEINKIKGRRISYWLNQTQTFDATNAGNRGNPMSLLVSQDGPFVATHMPYFAWRASAPSNATTFGFWRPVFVSHWPDQVIDTDYISLSWEMVDGGSQRNQQNLPIGPIGSTPNEQWRLDEPVLYTPNTTIQIIPTYEAIQFNGAVAPTQGTLWVGIQGWRIANM